MLKVMALVVMSTINFYSVSEPYGDFSNFSNHPIFLDGTTWPTVEHYFQAQKFKDGKIMYSIQIAKTPYDAAKLGRDRGLPLRENWEEIKDGVMYKAVKAKFLQYENLRNLLLSTGDAEIVEHTKSDPYWGDGGNGSGQNKLGKILMQIRQELLEAERVDPLATPKLPPWGVFPDIARSNFKWSMGAPEEYLSEWLKWYLELPNKDKERYIEVYPEPEGWDGFYRMSGAKES